MIRRSTLPRRIADSLFKITSAVSSSLGLLIMIIIVSTILYYGASMLSIEFLTSPSKSYGEAGAGIANAILGTLLITFGAALIALPPAMAAGIYLAEYGRDSKLASILRFTGNVLMGIPSVVVGIFVYALVVVSFGRFSGFAGSVALAFLMFPVVMRTTEDMLRMVNDSLRESVLALGETRSRGTPKVIFRAARGGILTGVLLALARVSGETAPLLFTALFADSWPTSYFSGPTASLPVLITDYTMNSPFEAMHRAGWGAAFVIAAIILAVNLVSRYYAEKEKQ